MAKKKQAKKSKKTAAAEAKRAEKKKGPPVTGYIGAGTAAEAASTMSGRRWTLHRKGQVSKRAKLYAEKYG